MPDVGPRPMEECCANSTGPLRGSNYLLNVRRQAGIIRKTALMPWRKLRKLMAV